MRQEVSGRAARTLDALGSLPSLLSTVKPYVYGDKVMLSLGHDWWIDVLLEDTGEFTLERYMAARPFVRVHAGTLDGIALVDLCEVIEWSGFWPFTFGG